MVTEGDMVRFGEARRRLNVSHPTFRAALRANGVPVYGSPLDRRVKFVRESDLARLAEFRPLDPKEAPSVAS